MPILLPTHAGAALDAHATNTQRKLADGLVVFAFSQGVHVDRVKAFEDRVALSPGLVFLLGPGLCVASLVHRWKRASKVAQDLSQLVAWILVVFGSLIFVGTLNIAEISWAALSPFSPQSMTLMLATSLVLVGGAQLIDYRTVSHWVPVRVLFAVSFLVGVELSGIENFLVEEVLMRAVFAALLLDIYASWGSVGRIRSQIRLVVAGLLVTASSVLLSLLFVPTLLAGVGFYAFKRAIVGIGVTFSLALLSAGQYSYAALLAVKVVGLMIALALAWTVASRLLVRSVRYLQGTHAMYAFVRIEACEGGYSVYRRKSVHDDFELTGEVMRSACGRPENSED